MKNQFSKDPKVKLVSVKEFLEASDYLSTAKQHLWKENEAPDLGTNYKITSSFLIQVEYDETWTNFGTRPVPILHSIIVAYRNGKTEYELLDLKINNLLKNKNRYKHIEHFEEKIKGIEQGKKLLQKNKFKPSKKATPKTFEEYIVDTEYKTSIDTLLNQYVVFDVETNGTRKSNDDLLSISIYNPTDGKCYNRYLPLDLQPLVLSGWINGISDKDLENQSHFTQEEIDKLIEFFDLKNKTLLSFSGGQGEFDSTFIINYCKRHNLVGFENLHYENIKSMFPDPGYGFEGQLSKDNLCKLLKIDGVQEIHTSINDCILEWKLFEQIKTKSLFFINQHLFNYQDGYIVPVSYLNRNYRLANYANISVPNITGTAH